MHPGEVFPLYRFGRTGPVLLRDRGFTVQCGLSERKEHDMCKHARSRIAMHSAVTQGRLTRQGHTGNRLRSTDMKNTVNRLSIWRLNALPRG